jgi:uncharacterized membrane-anchored protein
MNTPEANNSHLSFIKVPVIITLFFWVIKILATTVGETGADFLIFNMHFGLSKTSVLMSILLAIFFMSRLKAKPIYLGYIG